MIRVLRGRGTSPTSPHLCGKRAAARNLVAVLLFWQVVKGVEAAYKYIEQEALCKARIAKSHGEGFRSGRVSRVACRCCVVHVLLDL